MRESESNTKELLPETFRWFDLLRNLDKLWSVCYSKTEVVSMKRTEWNGSEWKFPFVMYTPEKMEEKMPLIIQLHGGDERGAGGEELALMDVHGFSHLVKERDYPCILVMPQCPKNSFWSGKVESVLAFIEQIKRAFPVDEDRVCLSGLSMGGFGTWYVAMARPDIFAAIAPMCGGGMAWNAGVLNMPIWAFHGADDVIVDPFHSDNMVEKLRELGKNVIYTRMEGVGHRVYTLACNDELMQWLLRQKRA